MCTKLIRPILMKMDCALELMDGCIRAFRIPECIHVANSQTYNTCVILIILRYEAMKRTTVESDLLELAKSAYQQLLYVTPTIFKQCKSHVGKAIREYPTNCGGRKNIPTEIRLWKNQFQQLFSHVAKVATEGKSMSEVIATLSVVVNLLRTEFIPCGVYSSTSETAEHHPRHRSKSIAEAMDFTIREQMNDIQIDSEEEYTDLMSAEFDNVHKSRPFSGNTFATRALDAMSGKVAGIEPLEFAIPYLKRITNSGKSGFIHVCYVISPNAIDEDGSKTDSPQLLGGVFVEVPLPHASGVIRNPLYSNVAAEYVLMYWMNRIGLWNQSIIDLSNLALDANVFPCNNSLEGFISWEKNCNLDLSQDISDVASLIDKKWRDSVGMGKLLANQITMASTVVERREKRKAMRVMKATRASAKSNKGQSDNNKDGGMLWKRTPGTIKAKLHADRERMMSALEIGRSRGDYQYDDANSKSIHRAMSEYACNIDSNFMGIDTFRKWMNGTRTNSLNKTWCNVIEHMYDKYFPQ